MSNNDVIAPPKRRMPRWVGMIILGLGLINPISHWAIRHFPPEGTVPSGLHTVDTGACLTAMAHCGGDFYSPYARCRSEFGTHHSSLYSLPHHNLYGAMGVAGRFLRIPPFYMLALANGTGLAFYLLAAYLLLRVAVPHLANLAFLLFALGGGLGGVLYVAASVLGMNDHPLFPEYFYRYFIAELCEGARFQPHLLAARLYYTLPLGLGLLAISGTIAAAQERRYRWLPPAALALALGCFLNFRVGPMVWSVAIAYLICADKAPGCIRWTAAAALTGGLMAGLMPAAWMLSRNPELVKAVGINARSAMWLSPFISATFFYWLVVPCGLFRILAHLPRLLRAAGYAALGYVAAYLILYAIYQAYYGNFWRCLDFTVAVRMCDWALLGAPFGAAYGFWRIPDASRPAVAPGVPWAALWFLGFFAVSFSAFGQGWFLRFTPDRFAVMLGLPLAILGAVAMRHLHRKHPYLAAAWVGTVVCCGIASILVTWTVSYGPLGYRSMQQHFPWTRWAFIHKADAHVLERLGPGVALTPSLGNPLFGDIIALRPENAVVYGNGTIDYSREVMPELRKRVMDFYSPETSDAARMALLRDWCVDYVFCPDTDPIAPEMIEILRAAPYLREVASQDHAVLFMVTLPADTDAVETVAPDAPGV